MWIRGVKASASLKHLLYAIIVIGLLSDPRCKSLGLIEAPVDGQPRFLPGAGSEV